MSDTAELVQKQLEEMEEERLPWERQKSENFKRFEAFKEYRDMGPDRSYTAVAEKLQKSLTLMRRWAKEDNWKDRVAAYDDYLDKLELKKQEEERKKMTKRHINLALSVQNKLVDKLNNLKGSEIKVQDIPKFLETAVKIERLSRGESTENHAVTGKDGKDLVPSNQYEHMSDEELKAKLAELEAQNKGLVPDDRSPAKNST